MKEASKLSIYLLGFTYIIIFAFWFLYRYFTRFPDTTDELVVKPVIWISPVIFISLWKNLKFSELGFKKLSFKFISLSIACGIGLAMLQFFPIYLQNHKFPSFSPNFTLLTIATIGTAISEEILFRGFFFRELKKHYSSALSNGITSILFSLIHLPVFIFIQYVTGTSLLVGLYVTFTSSVIFCLLYSYTKNLWSPIITHFILNTLLLLF